MSSKRSVTRQSILEATRQLLESGSSARMTDIAKRAGVSRQAVYLHFANRAELLIETTLYVDQEKDVGARLAPSRQAANGEARLDAYIEAWGNYIPEIYPMARALMGLCEHDEEAARAWSQRMWDMREGCEAALLALQRDGRLSQAMSFDEAVDLLWSLLSVRHWQQLTQISGWSQAQYLQNLQWTARRLFIAPGLNHG